MTGGDRTGGGIPEFEANMATFDMSNWCWLAVLLTGQLPVQNVVAPTGSLCVGCRQRQQQQQQQQQAKPFEL